MSHTIPQVAAQGSLAGPTVFFPPKLQGRNPSITPEKEKPRGNVRSHPDGAEHQAGQCPGEAPGFGEPTGNPWGQEGSANPHQKAASPEASWDF